MGVKIELNEIYRRYLKEICSVSETGYVTLVLENFNLYFVGSCTTYDMVLHIPCESEKTGIFRLHCDNLNILALYDKVDIDVTHTDLVCGCYRRDKLLCGIKIPKEAQIDYSANDLCQDLKTLTNPQMYNIGGLGGFMKFLRLLDEGLCIKDGYVFGEGQGFSLYSIIDKNLDLAVSNEVVKKLVRLFGDKLLMYDLGNRGVGTLNGCCYLAFRKFRVRKKWDLEFLKRFNRLGELCLSNKIGYYVKGLKTKDAVLIFNLKDDTMSIKSKTVNIKLKLNIDAKECLAETDEIKAGIDLDIFKTIISSMDFKEIKFAVYERIILVQVGTMMFIVSNTCYGE